MHVLGLWTMKLFQRQWFIGEICGFHSVRIDEKKSQLKFWMELWGFMFDRKLSGLSMRNSFSITCKRGARFCSIAEKKSPSLPQYSSKFELGFTFLNINPHIGFIWIEFFQNYELYFTILQLHFCICENAVMLSKLSVGFAHCVNSNSYGEW